MAADPMSLERRLIGHSYQLRSLAEGLERTDANAEDARRDVKALTEKVDADHEMLTTYIAESEARQKTMVEMTAKGATAKQLYVTMAGVTVAIIAFLASIHA